MTTETMTIIVSVLAIIIAAYSIWKAGKPVTVQGVGGALSDAIPVATELAQVALTGVQAAEQLARTGKIARTERLDQAFAYVKKFYPKADQGQILLAIEAAVLVVNSVVEALPDTKPRDLVQNPPVGRMGL